MPAPVFELNPTETEPKIATEENLKASIDAGFNYLYDLSTAIATGNIASGDWDASTGVFPSGAMVGTFYNVVAEGTVDGKLFKRGDWLYPLVDNASTTTYAGNWSYRDFPNSVIYNSVPDLTASNETSRGTDGLWSLKTGLNYLEVDSNEDITTASGVKLAQWNNFRTRGSFKNAVANGFSLPSGSIVSAEGLLYIASFGATDLDGLDGWKPTGEVSVKHFGAAGDGVNNDLPEINDAFAYCSGVCVLNFPAGTYNVNGEPKVPSNTTIKGVPGATTIKQVSTTMSHNVLTTETNTRTNSDTLVSNIFISGIIFDGNYTRLAGPYSGISHSGGCGLSMTNADNFGVEDCVAINCTKHGFDISSSTWNVSGDDPTTRPLGGSRNGYLKNCSATNFGDDGITTHYSYNIDIISCSAHDSGDFYSVGNSNGLEIDDGSHDIRVFGGRFDRNSRGVQIKGHDYAPAAQGIRLSGVTCESNSQNFVLLHDGFDSDGDPISVSAKNVVLSNCISIAPRQKNASGLDRRAISVLGYGGVSVENMKIIGADLTEPPADDPSYVTSSSSSSMVAIAGNARNVKFTNTHFDQVQDATTLVKINASSSQVSFYATSFENCLGLHFDLDSGINSLKIIGVEAHTDTTVPLFLDCINSPSGADYVIENVNLSGFTNAYELAAETYAKAFDINRGVVRGWGDESPEGTHPATRGSTYQRTGASGGLYVKTTGLNTSTGWTLVS